MNFLISLSAVFLSFSLLIFPQFASGKDLPVTLDKAVLKLENDISLGKKGKVISSDLESIRTLREDLPVRNIPELFYLLDGKGFKFDRGKINSYEKYLSILHFSVSILMPLIVLLSLYSSIFFIHSLRLREGVRNAIAFAFVLMFLVALILKGYFLFIVFSLAAAFQLCAKKVKLASVFVILVSALVLVQSGEKSILSFLLSDENLLCLKLERDGYAPEFLIEKESNKLYRDFELIANRQAFGYLNLREELEKLGKATSDVRLKAAVYNNIGFEYYRMKDFDKALDYFKRSNKLFENPKVMYNIYLTYASKLDFRNAEKVLKSLKGGVPEKLKPVPILIHISDFVSPNFRFSFLWKYEAVFILLLVFLYLILSKLKLVIPRIYGAYFFIPGFRNFSEGHYFSMASLILLFISISALVEVLLCM